MENRALNIIFQKNTPQELFPAFLILIIVWCLVWVSISQMRIFPKRVKIVLSVCVSFLALLGITEEQIKWILKHYAAMAIVLLVGLASAIRIFWKKMISKNK